MSTTLLQGIWDWVLVHDHWLRSPFFPVLFSLGTYLLFCLPYVVLDILSPHVELISCYKIQQKHHVSWRVMWTCLVHSVYNHVVFIFPLTVIHWCWRQVSFPVEAPHVLKVAQDLVTCLLLFDFQYFVWHMLHHKVPWLYRTFHKVHHKYTSTFALCTEYSGMWETLSLGFFAAITPQLLGCHPLTELLFFVLNIWLSVEDHCGYDFPWATHRLVPFGLYGGAPHHDLHHLKFKSNYAPYFTHWDRLFGTLHED
ncbi:hypothetical protein ACEWY4_026032 [Coilia grayii]|uniref:Fatty acid hydroxylase domain-containing protein n=1 Tax=Coilia grayii TaxID=363190 RepID=A0ABD1ITN7_9TELE